jgi:hypothetical protein
MLKNLVNSSHELKDEKIMSDILIFCSKKNHKLLMNFTCDTILELYPEVPFFIFESAINRFELNKIDKSKIEINTQLLLTIPKNLIIEFPQTFLAIKDMVGKI